MNLQQFCALKESYSKDIMSHNIHELSADLGLRASKEASKRAAILSALGADVPKAVKKAKKFRGQAERFYDYQAKKRRANVTKEDLDIYDIILSHLLDEGYAETVEAAEVIMVNMSEEWRESICEELTGERRKRALEKGGYLADRVATGKEGQPVERLVRGGVSGKGPKVSMRTTTKAPTKRGGEEEKGKRKADWSGYAADRGSGNRARRRAGKKVIDTWDGY